MAVDISQRTNIAPLFDDGLEPLANRSLVEFCRRVPFILDCFLNNARINLLYVSFMLFDIYRSNIEVNKGRLYKKGSVESKVRWYSKYTSMIVQTKHFRLINFLKQGKLTVGQR